MYRPAHTFIHILNHTLYHTLFHTHSHTLFLTLSSLPHYRPAHTNSLPISERKTWFSSLSLSVGCWLRSFPALSFIILFASCLRHSLFPSFSFSLPFPFFLFRVCTCVYFSCTVSFIFFFANTLYCSLARKAATFLDKICALNSSFVRLYLLLFRCVV